MSFSSRAALCVISVVLLASPARAANEDAETFFAQGRKLRVGGDCPNAIVAFRRALDLKPEGLGALRNIAECEESAGQFASARNDWWSLRRAVLQSNDLKYEGWEKDAEEAYTRLAGKVARLTVRITGDSLDRVSVMIDGKPLDPRLLGVELERDLGLHTIEAAYGGAAPVVEKRALAAGAAETVTLKIPTPNPANGPAALAPEAPPIAPPEDHRGLRAAGYVALGVGGLGALGTVVAVIIRSAALSTVDKSCPEPTALCRAQQPVLDAYSRGQTSSTLANVFGGLGIAGVGVGVVMLVVAHPTPAASSAPAGALKVDGGLSPLPGGGQVWAGVRF